MLKGFHRIEVNVFSSIKLRQFTAVNELFGFPDSRDGSAWVWVLAVLLLVHMLAGRRWSRLTDLHLVPEFWLWPLTQLCRYRHLGMRQLMKDFFFLSFFSVSAFQIKKNTWIKNKDSWHQTIWEGRFWPSMKESSMKLISLLKWPVCLYFFRNFQKVGKWPSWALC